MNQTSDPKNAQWGVTVVHTDTEMEGHSRCDTENAETMSAALLTGFNIFSKYRAIPSQCHFFSSPRFFLFKFFFHLVFWIYFIYDKKMELLLKYVITLKIYKQDFGSGLILTRSGYGSNLSGQTGSNLLGQTGSGSRNLCL